jgi:hypothetical protein
MRASITKPKYDTRNKELTLKLLRHIARKKINPNLASDVMYDADLTLLERNEKMVLLHEKEMQQNRKQLQTLLPLHFKENCFVISIDMYIPLPFEKLSEKQQIERYSAQFRKELRKLPLTRPLFVLCGYRIPPPTTAAHSWAFMIDGDNVMYVYDPDSENTHHSTSQPIRRSIPPTIKNVHFCSYMFNRKIDSFCGLYGACHWGSFAILYLSALCFDKGIDQLTLCIKLRNLNADFLATLLNFVNTHVHTRATASESDLISVHLQSYLK